MDGHLLYNALLIGFFALAAVIFVVLFFVSAPYGRHIRRGWGLTIDNRLGWLIMEAPAALGFALWFALGEHQNVTAWVFLLMWEAHYVHRAFIYPFMLRGPGKQMPAAVTAMAFFFNVANSSINACYLFTLSGGYPVEWLLSTRFIVGAALFVAGFVINRQADDTLRRLRQPGESAYKLPRGGLFRWISSPNYFGEIVEWISWAVATWSLPGLAFAVWTVANLAPRARSNHLWYREHFPDYPSERKALLPGVW